MAMHTSTDRTHPLSSWSNQLVLSSQSLFWLSICFLLGAAITSVQCQAGSRVAFDLQELTHDSPVIDPEKLANLSILRGESLKYHLKGVEVNQTLRFFLAKPYKVREVEAAGFGPLVSVQSDSSLPYIMFIKANANHRGNYHLYSFVFDPEGRLVNYDRMDFHVAVKGLLTESQQCTSDDQCDSGHSMYRFCTCRQEYPIYAFNSCLEARSYNETCKIDKQCQEFGGPDAECYHPWGSKCRCNAQTVPIKISTTQRTCVPLAQLHQSCLYSKQCSLVGDNRFCNGDYRCECIPGYKLESGRYCTGSAVALSGLSSLVLLLIVATQLTL